MNRACDHAAPPSAIAQAWLLLAVVSLGIGAVAAFALVLARTPGPAAFFPVEAFPRALVVHVNCATLIWYISVACGLWGEGQKERFSRRFNAGLGFALLGAAGIVVGGVLASGVPVLANYIPFVDSPVFLSGLACFAIGALAVLTAVPRAPRDAAEWGFLLARVPFGMAALYCAIAVVRQASLEEAFWGAGHIMQFGHVALLMAIWLRLIERAGGRAMPVTAGKLLFALAVLPSVAGPLVAGAGILEGDALHRFHTELMRWTNWPAPLGCAVLLLLRAPAAAGRASEFVGSVVLLIVGVLAGLAINSQTTLIPAHYHGTIGAFTIVLMAAVMARSSSGQAGERGAYLSLPMTLYACGTTTLIAGLAWSGFLGAARKAPFTGSDELGPMLAASLIGLGGTVAVLGVCLFVLIVAPRIFRLCFPRLLPLRPTSAAVAPTFALAPSALPR